MALDNKNLTIQFCVEIHCGKSLLKRFRNKFGMILGIISILLFLVIRAFPVFSDTIKLNNGSIINGVIVNETEQFIKIETLSGMVTLQLDNIKEISREDNGQIYLHWGNKLLEKSDVESAKKQFHQAELYPATLSEAKNRLESLEAPKKDTPDFILKEMISELNAVKGLMQTYDIIKKSDSIPAKLLRTKDLRPLIAELHLKLAYQLYNHCKYYDALEEIIKASEAGAPEANLHFLIGLIDNQQGRFGSARREIELALVQNPKIIEDYPQESIREILAIPREEPASSLDMLVEEMPSNESIHLEEINKHINHYSKVYAIDPLLIESVITMESGFNSKAVSPKGALGLMQLMPGTAKDMAVKDPFNPEENIKGGSKYLRLIMDMFNGDLTKTLAAYNAGPQKVRFYKGVPPYPETKRYVNNVLNHYKKIQKNGSRLLTSASLNKQTDSLLVK